MVEYVQALTAGAIAGTSVDTILFPLDTIKTRLQSKQGFLKSGGFKNIYSGLSSAILGSSPSAAFFFLTYETAKKNKFTPNTSINHMIAASMGEIMACFVRVPTEVIKQRMQVGRFKNLKSAAIHVYKGSNIFGFYKGFGMTVFREIPFASIQFPLYEHLKVKMKVLLQREINSIESGLCGMVAGGTAAAITTPLDVLKTRIMLNRDEKYTIVDAFKDINKQGPKYFFSGIVPRVFWISIGGSIFLGVYDKVSKLLKKN